MSFVSGVNNKSREKMDRYFVLFIPKADFLHFVLEKLFKSVSAFDILGPARVIQSAIKGYLIRAVLEATNRITRIICCTCS